MDYKIDSRKLEKQRTLKDLEKRLAFVIDNINNANVNDKDLLEYYGERYTSIQELISYVSKFK